MELGVIGKKIASVIYGKTKNYGWAHLLEYFFCLCFCNFLLMTIWFSRQ